jgi:hypothetical protein
MPPLRCRATTVSSLLPEVLVEMDGAMLRGHYTTDERFLLRRRIVLLHVLGMLMYFGDRSYGTAGSRGLLTRTPTMGRSCTRGRRHHE